MSTSPSTEGRVVVVRRGNTVVPNATVYDEHLSYAALGILVVLLARPDTAAKGYRTIQGRGLGESATRAALRELDESGYRHQFRRSAGKRGVRTDTVVSEVPLTREQAEAELAGTPLLPHPPRRPARPTVHRPVDKSFDAADIQASMDRGHDGPRHVPYGTQGLSTKAPGDTNACVRAREGRPCRSHTDAPDCRHGMPHAQACALCRPAPFA